jgi:hypothetical protein
LYTLFFSGLSLRFIPFCPEREAHNTMVIINRIVFFIILSFKFLRFGCKIMPGCPAEKIIIGEPLILDGE